MRTTRIPVLPMINNSVSGSSLCGRFAAYSGFDGADRSQSSIRNYFSSSNYVFTSFSGENRRERSVKQWLPEQE